GGLEGAGGDGEGRGGGVAGQVGVARGIDGDGLPEIGGAAAEVGTVGQGAAGGVQLGDEDVGSEVPETGLEGAVGGGEVRRGGGADHVGVAVAANRQDIV